MPALLDTALTTLLLTAGLMLCAAGLAGFTLNWRTAPDRHDLATARHTALTGVTATALGLLILAAHDPLVLLVVICTAVAVVSLLTLAPMRHLPRPG